jgi:hypothetical protein
MLTTTITPATTICRNEERFLSNQLGDELVMMDQHTGDYINLNNVGADIWNMLNEPITVNDVLERTVSVYAVTKDEAVAPVYEFIKTMYDQNLILVHHQVMASN